MEVAGPGRGHLQNHRGTLNKFPQEVPFLGPAGRWRLGASQFSEPALWGQSVLRDSHGMEGGYQRKSWNSQNYSKKQKQRSQLPELEPGSRGAQSKQQNPERETQKSSKTERDREAEGGPSRLWWQWQWQETNERTNGAMQPEPPGPQRCSWSWKFFPPHKFSIGTWFPMYVIPRRACNLFPFSRVFC